MQKGHLYLLIILHIATSSSLSFMPTHNSTRTTATNTIYTTGITIPDSKHCDNRSWIWTRGSKDLVIPTANLDGGGTSTNSTHPLLGRCAMECPSGYTAIMCTCAVTRPAATWELHQCLMGGHHGIVRAWCPVTPTTSCTAGEDAPICERKNDTLRINTISSLPPDIANTSMFESEPMDNSNDSNDHKTTHQSETTATTAVATHQIQGGPIRRHRRTSNTTTKPY